MNSSPGLLLRYRRSIQPNAYICLYIYYIYISISHMEHMVWLKNEAGSGYLHNFDCLSKFCPFKLPLSWSKSIIFGHTHIIYHMVGDRSNILYPHNIPRWHPHIMVGVTTVGTEKITVSGPQKRSQVHSSRSCVSSRWGDP